MKRDAPLHRVAVRVPNPDSKVAVIGRLAAQGNHQAHSSVESRGCKAPYIDCKGLCSLHPAITRECHWASAETCRRTSGIPKPYTLFTSLENAIGQALKLVVLTSEPIIESFGDQAFEVHGSLAPAHLRLETIF